MIETVSMLLYIERAMESSGAVKVGDIISPSGERARYVGMAG
jgi:hypothetical protein